MFSLLALINRHAHLILFLFFEIVSFFLIVNFNQKQRDIFIHSSSLFSGTILSASSRINQYFELEDINQRLLQENARMQREIIDKQTTGPMDSSSANGFTFDVIPARIISQTTHSLQNHLTINLGKKQGLNGARGLITADGVVGILTNSTENFSSALSILNTKCRISAGILGRNYFGTVVWKGREIKTAYLEGIPIYADIIVGDRVITNGYSTIFPEGIDIGAISEINSKPKGSYHEIKIKLANDFSQLNHVFVIQNNFAAERQQLNLE